jgi:2'-5' RNA ligase
LSGPRDSRKGGAAFSTVRVFFALWPDADARDRLAALANEVAARTRGRAPPAGNLHVTLAFIGEIPRGRVEALSAIGASIAARTARFVFTLDRTGTFRGTGVIWAGASQLPPALAELARELSDALAEEDFAVERRPFSPHVTLVRRARAPEAGSLAAPIGWTVARLALVGSETLSGAPRYSDLATWPLGGGNR